MKKGGKKNDGMKQRKRGETTSNDTYKWTKINEKGEENR